MKPDVPYPQIQIWCPLCSIQGIGCVECGMVGKTYVCEACLDTGRIKSIERTLHHAPCEKDHRHRFFYLFPEELKPVPAR